MTANERNIYRDGIRRAAGVLALLFAFIAAFTAAHYHGDAAGTSQTVASACAVALSDPAVEEDAHDSTTLTGALTAASCVFCDWISTPSHSLPLVSIALFVVLSTIATLILAVRVAALCAAPAPRRGLRAPPVLSFA